MDKEEFSRRLAQLRIDKNVSARDMSLSIGQNPGYINNIENGRSYPTMDKFFFICEYLGLTPQEFFDIGTPDPIKAKKTYTEIAPLSSAQLDVILSMAREMKK